MKFYLLISLMSLILLSFAPAKSPTPKAEMGYFTATKEAFQSRFQKKENASVLWAILTGERSQVSGKTLHAFKEVNLTFLFHLSGLQISSLLLLFHWVMKKWLSKNKKKGITALVLAALYFLPLLTIKRIVLLRLINLTSFFKKYIYEKEIHFFICFIICFFLGHYQQSPGSFVASFLYIGTFISLAQKPMKQMVLAMIANQFLLALCWQQSFNAVGVILSLPLFSLATLLAPLGYCYLISFRFIKINWIEFMVENYLRLVKMSAKFAHSMETIPSLMLLLLVWLFLFQAKPRTIGLIVCLCSAVAIAPTISY